MMIKEGSTKIVNFMIIGAGVLMLGRGHLSHNSEYRVYIIFYSINIQHIDCHCVKVLWSCFPIPSQSLIFIYSMIGLLIYKYEPFRQEVSVMSLIFRWLLRPVGLLFSFYSEDFCCYMHNINSMITVIWKSFCVVEIELQVGDIN